ncbi:ceramidase domain-containing protein [Catenovulum maritimum]|uniref:Ceramidase n=1 Tax=Catenovulum maritimum TaxID=1513271 RepID=A0A0J8GWG3_9ALTE|nr:ceramidase domain-containing protein [Catenovulum maritimum]KMT65003.1 hypothetical protein XM47_10995 [Catenovulum maritimum]
MDFYCERLDLSFWSEPVNALTNLGFILAGLFALTLLNRHKLKLTHLNLLAYFMIIIGIGSFLFHTFASRWALFADVLPIYFFQLIFLFSYQKYALNFNTKQIIFGFVLFILAVVASKSIPVAMNGSEMYLPTIVALVVFSCLYKLRQGRFDFALLIASGVFSLSLLLRTIDNAICQDFPLGTHFGWHLLNAIVLFFTWYSLYLDAKAKA